MSHFLFSATFQIPKTFLKEISFDILPRKYVKLNMFHLPTGTGMFNLRITRPNSFSFFFDSDKTIKIQAILPRQISCHTVLKKDPTWI